MTTMKIASVMEPDRIIMRCLIDVIAANRVNTPARVTRRDGVLKGAYTP